VVTPPSQPPVTPPDPESGPCAEELAVFEADVHRPIVTRLCVGCHAPGGPGAQSRLQLATAGSDGAVRHDWHVMAALAADVSQGSSVLLSRASGEHRDGHPGGALVLPGTSAHAAFLAFEAASRDPECNAPAQVQRCEGPRYGPRVLRRLTHDEYDVSIEALLGIESEYGQGLAVDPLVEGFANDARQLVVGALLVDQLHRNAEQIAEQAVLHLDQLLPCEPRPDTLEACRDLFISRLVGRAYRRPLSAAEHARYVQLFEATWEGEFALGAKWVMAAMLQSPRFLYRSELGVLQDEGTYRLTDYEIASALSYFLTQGPPDEELLRAASGERLQEPEERVRQVRRIMRTPAGQSGVARFFTEWLALDRVHHVPKASLDYRAFDDEVRGAMAQETEAFVRWVLLRGQGTLPELLTAPYTFLNPTLERFYGERAQGEPDARGFARADAPGRRFGLLTQGTLLSVHAKPSEASPIHRGKMVRERLLCETLPRPPADLSIDPPPVDPSLTARERYVAHAEVEPCRSCHRLIDPIGFGFSAFDGVGRHRIEEAGRDIDAHGEIVGTAHTDGDFDDLEGLATLLAGSEDVQACFTERWTRWAYGLGRDDGLGCVLEDLQQEFAGEDLRVAALLEALARSEHMAVRTASVSAR